MEANKKHITFIALILIFVIVSFLMPVCKDCHLLACIVVLTQGALGFGILLFLFDYLIMAYKYFFDPEGNQQEKKTKDKPK